MKEKVRKRLDLRLVEMGFVETRSKAQQLIRSGSVEVQINRMWEVIEEPAFDVSAKSQDELRVKNSSLLKFVSRGGVKLDQALEKTKLSIEGFRVLDIGQSTGGFSDCVLQRGAILVIGVDVGSAQLHKSLQSHPRVVSIEKLHAADLNSSEDFLRHVADHVDLIVADVSFISLTKVLGSSLEYLKPGGYVLALVKPQFELDRQALNNKGIVKDPKRFLEVEDQMRTFATTCGLNVLDYFPSSLKGQDGNQEFFIYAQKN